MKIGYACLTENEKDIKYRTCNLKNITEPKLLELIENNLNSLDKAIEYNIKNNIKLFRITSDIIPFGSNEINNIKWEEIFKEKLISIGIKIKESNMRVSMHPGQYTVLNSNKEEVVERAIKDLEYHTKFLDSLNVDSTNKIILHIGGVYNDKENSIIRFIDNYKLLNTNIKKRLVIENDDKSYNISDIIKISKIINIPVVFDNLHNKINCYDKTKTDNYWISICNNTWKEIDGNQKIHYSQQDTSKQKGSHSSTIDIKEFMSFYNNLDNKNIDIMLEVKDKNISAIKCIKEISEK